LEEAGEAALEVAQEEAPKAEGGQEEGQAAMTFVSSSARRNDYQFNPKVRLNHGCMGENGPLMDS